MTIGPIQLVVFEFDTIERFRGEVLREMESLRGRGLVRVIDLLFVQKGRDGQIKALGGSSLTDAEKFEFGTVIGGLIGVGAGGRQGAEPGAAAGALAMLEGSVGLTQADVQKVAANLKPGTAAAFLLFEHTWATRFRAAIRDAGGRPVAQGFLTPEALLMVGRELEAVAEAQATIEAADAIKNAAMIDALATVAEARAVEAAAVEEAGQVVEAAEAIKAAAAAEALRALIVADVIEKAAAQEAVDALVAAGLIEAAAAEAAEQAASAKSSGGGE